MPIKLATPAPLTFELRSDPVGTQFFCARERPELSIHIDKFGVLFVNYNGTRCSTGEMSFADAERIANAIHARLCTFEQPQPQDEAAEPAKPGITKLYNPKTWDFCQEVKIKLPE